MIRDEDGALTGYIYIDLKNTDYGGFVARADKLLHDKLALPANYTFGGMITSTIHVLILVPVFFVMMKERALRRGRLTPLVTSESLVTSQS
jgi:Cu/Ag efflux pump CusA